MQKATRIAGDAARAVVVNYTDGEPSYDPVAGTTTKATTSVTVFNALVGKFTAEERERFGVVETMQKIVIASADLARVPEDCDYVTIGGASWRIFKVIEDMTLASVILAVEQP